MAGIGGQVLSHVLRRGLSHYHQGESENVAMLYSGDMHASPATVQGSPDLQSIKLDIPDGTLIATGIVVALTLLVVLSIDYTVGSLMASLAMIESPSTTTIVESKPPAYTEEPDAPLDKQPLLDEDVEVVVINHKPVTAHTRTTIKHLHRIGGWTARWRGLGQFALYHIVTSIGGHSLAYLFGGHRTPAAQVVGFIIATMTTCRLRMLWTHAVIAMPTATPWYSRMVGRKQSRVLLLPTFVYALAQQMVIGIPIGVALFMASFNSPQDMEQLQRMGAGETAFLVVRVLSVPATAILVGLFVLLPAATALTRVEACLLPEDQTTIVPFDKDAILGEIDVFQKGAPGQLFKSAWKSINGSTRFRVVKVYLKLFLYQFVVSFLGFGIALTILYMALRDQIAVLMQTYLV